MTEQTAPTDDLLASVIGALEHCEALPPHDSVALDVLTDVLAEEAEVSPSMAFDVAKYVLAQHARELAQRFIDRRPPVNVDPRFWAANQLEKYATGLDSREAQR
ncbi:hypothetical protein ACWCRC_32935 [Streptomyces sp. NPDC001940]